MLAVEVGAALSAIGELPDDEIDVAGAALQLARRDAPDASWEAAAAHLSALAQQAAALAPVDDPAERAAALASLLVGRYRYAGDTETYDDLANANLIRVIGRRRGLPVSLGILWLHAARAAGWVATGLNVANHFMVGLQGGGRRREMLAVDVFAGGRPIGRGTADTARLPVASNRETLLRLQNNILVRRLGSGALQAALICIDDMLRIAPDARQLGIDRAELRRRLGLPQEE